MNKGNMRLLTILAIVVLFIGAWYTLIDGSMKESREYNSYLKTAREKAEQELYKEAQTSYEAAMAMRDSIALRDEIADFYKNSGQSSNYGSFCEQIVDVFPFESMGYERLAEYYRDKNCFYECFSLISIAKKRGAYSNRLEKLVEELAYEYEITYVAYSDVKAYSGGLYAVKKDNGYWGYINGYGSSKISCKYEVANSFSGSGYAGIKTQDGKCFLIDTSGIERVAGDKERNIEDITNLISGKIALKYDGKYHYCDSQFEELFGAYDYAGSFYCGVAAVKDGKQWYIINQSGEKVTDATFEDIKVDDKGIAFRNNVAFAKKNGKYILIDTTGKKVGNEEWDDADVFNSELPAAVKKGEKWGFVSATGEVLVDYQYDGAKSFSNGMAAVSKDDRWGYIDAQEYKVRIEYSFDDANDFSSCGSAFVYIDDRWNLIKIYRLSKKK